MAFSSGAGKSCERINRGTSFDPMLDTHQPGMALGDRRIGVGMAEVICGLIAG
jgi:hypothetical protein